MKTKGWARLLPIAAGVSLVCNVAMAEPSLEDRVKRLERMVENPALFQMGELLADQQREMQSLQDRLDRVEYRYRKRLLRQQARIDSLEKRLDRLYRHLQEKGLAPEEEADEEDALIPPDAAGSDDENETTGGDENRHDADMSEEEAAGAPAQTARETAPAPDVGLAERKDASVRDAAGSGAVPDVHDDSVARSENAQSALTLRAATEDERSAYDEGMLMLRQYRYDAAAAHLKALADRHPESELAPQALYWAAEAEWKAAAMPEAAWTLFNRIIQHYPHSEMLPRALYRGAEALHEMKRDDEAKGLLKRLLTDYPDHSLAPRARALLDRLVQGRDSLGEEEEPMKGVDITERPNRQAATENE